MSSQSRSALPVRLEGAHRCWLCSMMLALFYDAYRARLEGARRRWLCSTMLALFYDASHTVNVCEPS